MSQSISIHTIRRLAHHLQEDGVGRGKAVGEEEAPEHLVERLEKAFREMKWTVSDGPESRRANDPREVMRRNPHLPG